MSVCVRRMRYEDLESMQECNLHCLPENYAHKYWMYHAISWPALQYVADAGEGRIVGYVLAKIDEENSDSKEPHGHITSLAVMRTYRKTGLATKLMNLSQRSMVEIYNVSYVSLHVRETNFAAYHLYKDTLNFEQHGIELKYYADGENAFDMRRKLSRELFGLGLKPGSKEAIAAKAAAEIASAKAAAEAAEASLLAELEESSIDITPVIKGGKKKEKEKKSAVKAVQPPILPKSSTLKISDESSEVLEAIEKAGSSMDLEPGLDDLLKANKIKSKGMVEK